MNSAVKWFVVMGFIVMGVVVHAQEWNGDWRGSIDVNERDVSFDVRIVIEGGGARQYFTDDDGWRLTDPVHAQFSQHRNNAHFFWLNSGGIWTETQSYHLSMIDDETIEVIYVRHVNNRAPGDDGEPWSLTGVGYLMRAQ